MRKFFQYTFLFLLLFGAFVLKGQTDSARLYLPLDYNKPAEYIIAGIETKGNKYIDKNAIIFNSNLSINQTIKIPGNEISTAIENLWKQDYFSSVIIYAKKIEGDYIYLVISVKERPRLSKFSLRGLGKSESKNLREELTIKAGMLINENLINRTKREITNHYYKNRFFG